MATGGREEDGEEWASQLLSKLCEDVGFSEEDWRFRLRACDITSTAHNFKPDHFRWLYSGSYSEGISADILGSDIDVMMVIRGIKVIEHGHVSPNEEDDVYSNISAGHPAFYKLKCRHTGSGRCRTPYKLRNRCLKYDPCTHMVVLNGTAVKHMFLRPEDDLVTRQEIRGPAASTQLHGTSLEMDDVISLHGPTWPSVSEEWKTRERKFDWPSPEIVNNVTELGCEYVAVGNPLSMERDIEWRLSSSAAERVLIRSLNIVQIQCYFLLKLVLVYIIKPQVPDALCSYHMKNIILWQVEKTATHEWRRANLAQCFTSCLNSLYQCLENGNLRQYFIPKQNLFVPKVQGEVRIKLISVVGELVREGWICLLKCAPFTNMDIGCMHQIPRCPCYIRSKRIRLTAEKVSVIIGQLSGCVFYSIETLSPNTSDNLSETLSAIVEIQSCQVVDAVYKPSQVCIDIINTVLSSHVGYMMLSVTRGQYANKNSKLYGFLQKAEQYIVDNCDVDMTSCQLKLATFYYKIGQVHKCIKVVSDALSRCTNNTVVSTPDAIRFGKVADTQRLVQRVIGILPLSDDIRALLRHVSFPVLFSPWEILNAPPAVQALAFHRRFESSIERKNFKVVAIDSLVYAYYLMTISYMEIGRPVQAERSLSYLRRMLRHPQHYQVYYPYEAQQLLYQCTIPRHR